MSFISTQGDEYSGRKDRVFALIDCNNFFVSCERLFRPDLEGRPVVVLSSNDGCAVSRSNEAKALDIPMGAPAFKYRDLFRRESVVQFSANFELYGDISRRITQLLTTITPRIEVYSVDESFLDLTDLQIEDYEAWGREVCRLVKQWVGVPVSIGIAPTKTLAKLAAAHTKKHPEQEGAYSFINKSSQQVEELFKNTPVGDIWGIGWRLSPKLRSIGLSSVYDLAQAHQNLARQIVGSKHGAQVVAELNGISCYGLTLEGRPAKSISRTRTFGEDTHDLSVLESAVANFCARAAHNLRRDNLMTRRASVFVASNQHKPNYKSWGREVKFDMPTADTGHITASLIAKLAELKHENMHYHRAGVLLYDFLPVNALQTDLLGYTDPAKHDRSNARMHVVDGLNLHYGKETIRFASELLAKSWEPKYNLRSPRYATRWDELQVIKT